MFLKVGKLLFLLWSWNSKKKNNLRKYWAVELVLLCDDDWNLKRIYQ